MRGGFCRHIYSSYGTMDDTIHVKQINLHHCIGATSLISKQLYTAQTKKQNLVVLIQEPWINKNTINGFDETAFDIFYINTSITKPRTCVITTKGMQANILPQHSSGDITTILLNIKHGNVSEELLLSSVYMPFL